jgi:undecaprenyl-diphosphatase
MRHALPALLVLSLAAPAQAASLDETLIRDANSWGAPTLDLPMAVGSNLGFAMGAPVLLGFAAERSYHLPVLVLGSELTAAGAALLIKPLVHRDRPYAALPGIRTPDGPVPYDPNSFPSGHAAVSFAAATAIADWDPHYAIPAYALATFVSYSRLYNGVHFPSDVLCGALIGFGMAKLTRWGYDSLAPHTGWPTPTQFSTGPVLQYNLQF